MLLLKASKALRLVLPPYNTENLLVSDLETLPQQYQGCMNAHLLTVVSTLVISAPACAKSRHADREKYLPASSASACMSRRGPLA